MFFQEQVYPHDPDNGVYGDCFRAVLASLLRMNIKEVPHFMIDNPDVDTCNQRLQEFLEPMGLFFMNVAAWDIESWKQQCKISAPIYHEISDESPRFPGVHHSVVGCDGIEVHDPHPTKLGLPNKTDKRTFGFLVRL